MDSIFVSTWNVEGKGSPEEVESLLSRSTELTSEHIVCVQQANLPSSGGELKNYTWLCSGKYGSAVLISKTSSLKSGSFEQVCEEICVAEVVTKLGTVLKVISCYIPPSTDVTAKDLWSKLTEVIKAVPCKVPYFIAGDFNAEIGKQDVSSQGNFRNPVGPKLHHEISNGNGIQLNKLALNAHIVIMNTFGSLDLGVPVYTYKDGEEKSQRSYILISSDGLLSFQSKTFQQDCKLKWYSGYKSTILSKSLKFTVYKYSKITASKIVSSWNVQGPSPSAVDKALSEFDLPMVCVQDLFLTSDKDVETKNYTWYTSKKLWGKNVGILIKSCSDISMADFEVVSDCLCMGNVTCKGCTFKVICCSLPPHTDSARFQAESSRLFDLVKNIPEETTFLIAGDFNTHITYTHINDTLVFNQGDENAMFVQKLIKVCNLELTYNARSLVTHVSEKIKRNSSFVLMSPGCMANYSHIRYVRWVPFFENGIVSLYLLDGDVEQELSLMNATKAENIKAIPVVKVEHADGYIFTTRKYYRIKRYLSVSNHEQNVNRFLTPDYIERNKLEEKSDLPDEVVSKYKNTPPPLEELLRILGDGFTLYFGFLQESILAEGSVSVLAASFEGLDRGMLVVECIDVSEEETNTHVKRIVKFRWNGITIHQHEGVKYTSYKRIINKGQSELISRLGQHCFTVKAKGSFYNGLPPQVQDESEFSNIFRFVKRKDFPSAATVEQVKKFTTDFLSKNPLCELLFGPDFSYETFLKPLKQFALGKSYGTRVFKSNKDTECYDNLSIFINRSPTEILKELVAIPDHQDLKFQLLPPCGTDQDYFEWIAQWEGKTVPDEYYKPYENKLESLKVTTTNGTPEAPKKSENLTEVNSTEAKVEKHSTGFVHKEIRKVGRLVHHRIMKCSNLATAATTVLLPNSERDWIAKAREESDLPQDVVKKYCEVPPPLDELTRILGDEFTLYYGFRREGSVVSTNLDIVSESFEALNRGGVMMEYIEVSKKGPLRRLVKFKWNGICIHEEKGSLVELYQDISQAGLTNLINKLGQCFYTVRAKISFFNKGLSPVCPDKDKLNEAHRVVKRSEFPESVTIENVKTFITSALGEFRSKNSYVELVFGPEFSLSELLIPIKKFAIEKEMGYRLFKTKKDLPKWDSIAFFIKRSPLEVRESLMKIPDNQDLAFFLIPPCELVNKSHFDWIKKWAAELYPEEFKLLKEVLTKPRRVDKKKIQKMGDVQVQNKRNVQSESQRKKLDQNPRIIRRPETRKRTRQEMEPHRETSRPQSFRSETRKRTWQEMEPHRETSRTQSSRSVRRRMDYNVDNSRSQPSRSERHPPVWERMDNREDILHSGPSRTGIDREVQQWMDYVQEALRYPDSYRSGLEHEMEQRMDYQREHPNSYPYRSEQEMQQVMDYQQQELLSRSYRSGLDQGIQQQMEYQRDQDIQQQMEYRGEDQRSQPYRSDDYDTPIWSGSQDYTPESAGRKPSWKEDQYKDEVTPSQLLRSDNYDISDWLGQPRRNPEPERYRPEAKHEREGHSRSQRPRWDDVAPLVIVWPVTIRSEHEKDSRRVLEANFPTQISLEPKNRVAVQVTLPLRNGREKTYRLCVGDGVHQAAKNALDMIVKRSTVIKHTDSFLPPGGLVPNFIRYNIPCQTNPRTYIMVSWNETGPLTKEKIIELFINFNSSVNEDLFFDKDFYTHDMKLMLLDLAPKHGLRVRHFGLDQKLNGRYICVYKTKPKDEVLEEVLKMRDFHPKFRMVSNKLPSRIGLNVF